MPYLRRIHQDQMSSLRWKRAGDLRLLPGKENRPRQLDAHGQSGLGPSTRSDSAQRWPRSARSSHYEIRNKVNRQNSRRQKRGGGRERYSSQDDKSLKGGLGLQHFSTSHQAEVGGVRSRHGLG